MRTIYVAGSVNVDVVARAARLPEPGETVAGHAFERNAGGKGANQAVAAAKQGARVVLVGRIGDDTWGAELRQFLLEHGVDVSCLKVVGAVCTGVALITVDQTGQNAIVVVPGANGYVSLEDVEQLPFAFGDVALAQLELPAPTVERFLVRARAAQATTILNPAPAAAVSAQLLDAADLLVVNETELAYFAGLARLPAGPDAALEGASLLQRRADQTVIVTLGAQGAVALERGRSLRIAGHRVSAADTTGAGDTFIGNLAAALVEGQALTVALERANAAAAYSVLRPGAAVSSPTTEQLTAWMRAIAQQP
jgi:ribokinase